MGIRKSKNNLVSYFIGRDIQQLLTVWFFPKKVVPFQKFSRLISFGLYFHQKCCRISGRPGPRNLIAQFFTDTAFFCKAPKQSFEWDCLSRPVCNNSESSMVIRGSIIHQPLDRYNTVWIVGLVKIGSCCFLLFPSIQVIFPSL